MKIALPIDRQKRSGATLTEVLMSLLIFSIGIVSVFTLFPVSLLSSIQATKLTNSKILADNINEIIRTRPSLILGGEPWLPGKAYETDDWVFPSASSGHLTPAHRLGYQSLANFTSQTVEPRWPIQAGNRVDERNTSGGVVGTWEARQITTTGFAGDSASITSFGRAYVVDPLGAALIDPSLADEFGNDELSDGAGLPRRSDFHLGLVNPTNGARDLNVVSQFFALRDSWTLDLEFIPVSITDAGSGVGTTVNLPTNVSADGFSTDPTLTRVVLSNMNRTRSEVRFLDAATTGNTLELTSAVPTSLNGPLRIETYNRRYSWFATVNRDTDGRTLAECVVVFNRRFAASDEELYSYTVPVNSGDTVDLSWSPPGEAKPLLREGNYCFDVRECRWHEIVNVNEGTNSARIVVSPALHGDVDTSTTGDMIFMPGIVTVFQVEL